MKQLSLLFLVMLCGCRDEPDDDLSMRVWSMATHIPIDDYYRKVIGYDSIQLFIRDGKLEANFCYPNKWANDRDKCQSNTLGNYTEVFHDRFGYYRIKNDTVRFKTFPPSADTSGRWYIVVGDESKIVNQ